MHANLLNKFFIGINHLTNGNIDVHLLLVNLLLAVNLNSATQRVGIIYGYND